MAPFFIDFEAFQHGEGSFKIKELCVLDADRPFSPLYFLFKADKKWDALDDDIQTTFSYQMRHIHKLGWQEGTSRYCRHCVWDLIKDTFPGCRNGIFYVLGSQKLNYLKHAFPKLNVVEYNTSFNSLPLLPPNISCIYREHGDHCACLKCYRLLKHYIELPY